MTAPHILHYVGRWELRAMFNVLRIPERLDAGDLILVPRVERFHVPRRSAIAHPAGAQFELYGIRDASGAELAVAQRFRDPTTGEILYSGRLDPMHLRDGLVRYTWSPARDNRPDLPHCIRDPKPPSR